MLTYNTLLDNSSSELQVASAIKDLVSAKDCQTIKIATGYWDIPGTALVLQELKAFLQKPGTLLQLLIGTDPVVRASQQKNPKYKDAQTQGDFIRCDLQNLEVKDEYVEAVSLLKEYCLPDFDASRIQIKMCKTGEDGTYRLFHAKCYIFLGNDFAKGIIGSSNFTQKGLEGNSELNYLEWDNAKVTAAPNQFSHSKGHNYWFDEKWAQAEEWNKTFLEEVLHGTPVEQEYEVRRADAPLTPYELYIKLLNYKFGNIIDIDQQKLIESYLPATYNPLDYQIEAVKQCFAIMHEHGGFMLADVVGLGKTIVGALIIKHFLTMPDDDGRERKVLIVTPPAIKSAWEETLRQFDAEAASKVLPFIDFITTGSISNLVDELGENEYGDDTDETYFCTEALHKNYGLILIDESHKFRNSQTAMYQSLNALIGEIGAATGLYPYIGLLSATPQNNRPSDLQNQIYLFERNHSDSTLRKANGGNIESFFSSINKRYGELIGTPKDDFGNPIHLSEHERSRRAQELKKLSEEMRSCILEDILVRRTRTDIIKYYGGKLTFPTISGPHSLEYKMEDGLAKIFAMTMDYISPSLDLPVSGGDYLCYYRYRAIEFLLDPTIKNLYKGGNIDPDRFSRQLAKIMQVNLVKRIESSFSAFKSSLENLRQYTQNMIDMWENDTIFICPDINVNAELNLEKRFEREHRLLSFKECIDDLREKIDRLNQKGRNEQGRNRELRRSDFAPRYIDLLRKDLTLINILCKKWNAYSHDPKLEEFKRCLVSTLFDPQRNLTGKLVIFSEAIDTVKTIKLAVETTAPHLKVLAVTAANRHDLEQTIRENFDANYERNLWKDDYQIIVTTEVLAEGINLHRANCILNYDTPWNATRLMQRIGRVNRIGSTAPFVYVYNFMPSAQGNEQIQLVQKAYTKLQSFHTLFGDDNQIFTEEEEVMHYDLNKQVNGEESPMEQYISELKAYKAAHPARFAQIAAKEEGLQLATAPEDGKSYFLVRTPNIAGLFVSVDSNLSASLLSGADMYRAFRTSPDALPAALPADWQQRKDLAELTVNQSLARMNVHTRNSAKATRAKEIILHMKEAWQLSKESKSTLSAAFRFVNNGNIDIINKVIALDAELNNGQSLFALTQDEADEILKKNIQKIVERVQQHHGKAEVYMALSK